MRRRPPSGSVAMVTDQRSRIDLEVRPRIAQGEQLLQGIVHVAIPLRMRQHRLPPLVAQGAYGIVGV